MSAVTPDLARLEGARLLAIPAPPEGMPLPPVMVARLVADLSCRAAGAG